MKDQGTGSKKKDKIDLNIDLKYNLILNLLKYSDNLMKCPYYLTLIRMEKDKEKLY